MLSLALDLSMFSGFTIALYLNGEEKFMLIDTIVHKIFIILTSTGHFLVNNSFCILSATETIQKSIMKVNENIH